MIKKIVIINIFSFLCFAQENIILIDSTSDSFYIDEGIPLPFSPDLSFIFSVPDTTHVIIEVHEILSPSNDSCFVNTNFVEKILDKKLERGKYKVWWDGKNSKGDKQNDNKIYVYNYIAIRKIKLLNGFGYIKVESKAKLTGCF